mmetsp:Transcript_47316/g.120752  ORF Transcript_47316/g.120752 Transcript_47316/m.120752 type:complete len:419 (-) Transcript_47316:13-1269(-)|eukprot:jgi/Tetstr1/447041/TSEL_003669.t1
MLRVFSSQAAAPRVPAALSRSGRSGRIVPGARHQARPSVPGRRACPPAVPRAAAGSRDTAAPERGLGGGSAGPEAGAPAGGVAQTARQRAWLEANEGVFDKLIDLFREKSRDENRKLIAYSQQWPSLAEGVFYRMQTRIQKAVNKPSEQASLSTLLKSVKNIHEEYQRYSVVKQKFESSPPEDWEGLVAQNHEFMQGAYFEYWERCLAMKEHTDEEAEEATLMLARVAALVNALDKASKDEEALDEAGVAFNGLLERISSLEDADAEIDKMQREGRLDPAMMLTMAKAYSGVKESPYVQEEVKDIMAHLYFKAKETAAAEQPPEVRILKHLLTMEDPMERNEAMDQAFEPGEAGKDGADQDFLTSTPPDLMRYVDGVLAAYETQKDGKNLLGQTAKLMDPEVIRRLQDIQAVMRRRYF